LFVDDGTGAIDLVMEPGNPRVLYAAMREARRHPWELVSGGGGSGIYRTTDGGDTWKKLEKGLPAGPSRTHRDRRGAGGSAHVTP
jgi:photosystem II stability/assembly factor-like uncharacterized protein